MQSRRLLRQPINVSAWLLALLLMAPLSSTQAASAEDVPASAHWYFHIDLEAMRKGGPGQKIYNWLREEVLADVREDSGINIEKELRRLTSYSADEDGAVLIAEGNFSQETRDIVMAFIASGGDIDPTKSSGKTYFHFGGNDDAKDDVSYKSGNIEFDVEALTEESFISMDLKNKIIVTATETHMQELLANNGRSKRAKGALFVLSAKSPLVQAGMKASAVGDEDWDSNILRNAKEVGFLIAAVNNKLALEAELLTEEAEMAESLASVARGLLSLLAFDDDMDAETVAILRGANIEAKGKRLSLSLAVDPDLVVATLSD